MRAVKPEVVVVTGASAGVGRATACTFAKQGAWSGLIGRSQDGLSCAKKEVEKAGGRAIVYEADVADPQGIEEAAKAIEEKLGPIDIWVNNAMVSVFSPFLQMTPEEFKRVTEVTYLGYVYGTMAALKRMVARDRGTIVQVGSALAYRSIPLQSAYCGAKHAIKGFTDSLRSELIHRKSQVTLTMVLLPAVNTPQFTWVKSRLPRKPQPVPPIYQPEVIANAIYWAAHHQRRELVVGGSTALVLFLNKFIPGLGDIYLGKTGYASQQTDEPADPNRPNNLWRSLPGDFGAHGEFDPLAKNRSLEVWGTTHRNFLITTTLAVLCAALVMRKKKGTKESKDMTLAA